jgi:hypothetical protein
MYTKWGNTKGNQGDGAKNLLQERHLRGAENKKPAFSGFLKYLVGLSRLELLTPTMSRWCSNQLSYSPILAARTLPVASLPIKQG